MKRAALRNVATVIAALFAFTASGCAVVAVTDAAVTVASTVVKVGATAVGMVADVAGAGVHAVTGGGDRK